MFQELDAKSVTIIVNAMEEVKVNVDEVVIKQKDEGNCLYIVESGVLTCTKLFVFVFFIIVSPMKKSLNSYESIKKVICSEN